MYFLANAGVIIPKVPVMDVMYQFAEIYGQWENWINDGEGGYKWQTLTTAGRYYGLDTSGAHGSLRDCQITLEVLRNMATKPKKKRKG